MNESRSLRSHILATPRLLVVGLLFFTACHHQPSAPVPAPAKPTPKREPVPGIASASSLIQAMREKYPSWYRTVSFSQKTTINPPSGGEIVQSWYEAAKLPGRLRIDTDAASKSGTLFAGDSVYSFSSGKLTRTSADLNELLVLGFDVYTQPASRTEAQLRSRGFDLSRFHEGTWDGKRIYVVGAMRGDTTSKQFWVDAERLVFLRLIENSALGRNDIRFEEYRPIGNGWIAERVEQIVNGKRRLLEEYSNVRVGEPLPDALFEPRSWATAPRSGGGSRVN
ncbi:MAG TPA: hypothetical protein VN706_25350 [Gemmatimonadaceae bacterium]|nr:hypothetical protein [Gemmatimonadaceae bacterium]